MVKLPLLVMLALTVLIGMGLRWREGRMAASRPAERNRPRPGWLAGRKRVVDRWITAAALAALATIVLLGGLNWLRIWQGS